MDSTPKNSPVSNKNLWIGRLVSAAPVLMLVMSGVMKIARTEEVVKGFADWPAGSAVTIGIVELACTVLYLIPRTAVLGALLLTAYLGGATAVSVRMGASFIFPVALGVLVWGGLYWREPRLHALMPLRR